MHIDIDNTEVIHDWNILNHLENLSKLWQLGSFTHVWSHPLEPLGSLLPAAVAGVELLGGDGPQLHRGPDAGGSKGKKCLWRMDVFLRLWNVFNMEWYIYIYIHICDMVIIVIYRFYSRYMVLSKFSCGLVMFVESRLVWFDSFLWCGLMLSSLV